MRRLAVILGTVLLLAAAKAEAAQWSRAYIKALPDDAFASIERTPEGKVLRHLPHHNRSGRLDLPHLCSALARLDQVRWRDWANRESARQHLEEHRAAQGGKKVCAPGRHGQIGRSAAGVPATE
ncbi:MAG TPA: hypothetical protein VMG58_11725 [Candidatus Sulfotelmatobacter sp.]|nr:hypothetical protein [Candidatus Sulfotelmatobacter sp.]